jgi:V/A-type H+-transporting ATPase subunit K
MLGVLMAIGAVAQPVRAATEAGPAAATPQRTPIEVVAIALSVAFVTAVSIVGSGIAVARIGSAAIGAAAEKPEMLTRSLLFVALAEGLAILGFAVAMMLMAKI